MRQWITAHLTGGLKNGSKVTGSAALSSGKEGIHTMIGPVFSGEEEEMVKYSLSLLSMS